MEPIWGFVSRIKNEEVIFLSQKHKKCVELLSQLQERGIGEEEKRTKIMKKYKALFSIVCFPTRRCVRQGSRALLCSLCTITPLIPGMTACGTNIFKGKHDCLLSV